MAEKPINRPERSPEEPSVAEKPSTWWKRLGDLTVKILSIAETIKRLEESNRKLGDKVEKLSEVVYEQVGYLITYQKIIEQQNQIIEQHGKRFDDFEKRLDDGVEVRVLKILERHDQRPR